LWTLLVLFWRRLLSSSASMRVWLGKYPTAHLGVLLLFMAFIAMGAMASISFNLHEAAIIRYTSEEPITFGRLVDHYGWHFIDSIPILEVWRAFGVEALAEGDGFWPGFLVLVFRVLIIAPSIALIRVGRKMEQAQPQP
jgi:hypothetical protein